MNNNNTHCQQCLELQRAGRTPTHAYLDISIDGAYNGRLIFVLRPDTVPITVQNFVNLIRAPPLPNGIGYTNTVFHRIEPLFAAVGGINDGQAGRSSFNTLYFPDENFILPFGGAGTLAMNNAGPNTNGSQFFITFRPTTELNGRNVVFGYMCSGFSTLQAMESAAQVGYPLQRRVQIIGCGVF